MKQKVTSVKKKAWNAFSLYVRTRDCLLTTGCASFGLCITCGKRYHIKLLQAGHFVPGRHNAVLFSEEGTHAQCYNCNINLRGNTLKYRHKIVEIYGVGYDEVLEKLSEEIVQFKYNDYVEIAERYAQKTKSILENQHVLVPSHIL